MEKNQLTSEVMKIMTIECQIEANPMPSYVWYEIDVNRSTPSFHGQSVFGTTKQIQRIYQQAGTYAMQCQAQSNGKTVQQEFSINVLRESRTEGEKNQLTPLLFQNRSIR